jgi:hypothetical protein
MDSYAHYKSSRAAKPWLKKSNKGKRYRRSISLTARPSDMSYITKDLEREYLRPSCRPGYSRPASTFIDWFFPSVDDEFEEMESETSAELDEKSLEEVMGKDAYKIMLCEHIEAEKQLERKVAAELEMQVKEMERVERERRVHEDVVDESWDLISTSSMEFDDWEEVIVE